MTSSKSAPANARTRVRAELTREIIATARKQLAEHGAAGLSLRAVSREMGMVSSALYRYFPSRDDLLTALIIDAYQAVGAAAENADDAVPRGDFTGRWLALTGAVRGWAITNPQEYGLIFGTPVPGYQAPVDTIDPAARVPLLMVKVLTDASAAGVLAAPAATVDMAAVVRADLVAIGALIAPSLPEHLLARAVMAWTQLIGSISFELFGHLHNVIHEYEAYFGYQMRAIAAGLGLPRA